MSRFLFLTVMLSAATAIAAEQAAPKIYIIPDDVDCVVRKQDRVTYCTDKNGAPITGELHRYKEKELVRVYPLENGILNGVAINYFISGGVYSEKPYVHGKAEGMSTTYYKGGAVENTIPYVGNQKEGVAKYYYPDGTMQGQGIFVANKLNGPSRLYTESGIAVYELVYQNGTVVSGWCLVKEKADAPDSSAKKKELSPAQINTINAGGASPQMQIGIKECAF